jgi:hypothetical protein
MGWICGQNAHERFISPRAFSIPFFKKNYKEKKVMDE